MNSTNYSLKDQIRDYWSARATTFDDSPGHCIRTDREMRAYASLIRRHAGLGHAAEVIDLGCGTGEVTRLLRHLGCRVTAIDLSDDMLARARTKHGADPMVTLFAGDAENPPLTDGCADAVICRNLLWTLTDPERAFAQWHRILRPDGVAIAFEGNWTNVNLRARIFRTLSGWLGRKRETDKPEFTDMLAQLPLRDGLSAERLIPLLQSAGFSEIAVLPIDTVTRAQLIRATWAERFSLLSFAQGRFMMVARKR